MGYYKKPRSEFGKWLGVWFCCSLLVGSIVTANIIGLLVSVVGIIYYVDKYLD